MKCTLLKVIILWLCCWPSRIQSVMIYDRNDIVAVDNGNSAGVELKDIRSKAKREMTFTSSRSSKSSADFAYNDADDVIHIIEPPQHFQELKRRHRQQHVAAIPMAMAVNVRVQQQQQHRIPNFAKSPASAMTKVKDHDAKVEKPEMNERRRQNNRRKPAIAALKALEAVPHDLLPQETQRVRAAENLLPVEAKFPLEILASVRQTERQAHQQHARPHVKQRVKMQKTHTVIMERGYEQTRFKHGHENRAGGLQAYGGGGKTLRRAQRVRRDANIDHAQQLATLNIEQGSRLLARLDALIKHATRYLPDDNDTATHNNVLDELRMRFQHEFEPKQLIGEIEPTTKPTTPERELYEILESSLNATDTIMQELLQTSRSINDNAYGPSHSKCSDGEASALHLYSGNAALQQLQSKVDCMRQQLQAAREQQEPITTTTTTTTTTSPASTTKTFPSYASIRGNKRFGQRTRNKTTTKSTTKIPYNKNLFRVRARAKDHQQDQQETPSNNAYAAAAAQQHTYLPYESRRNGGSPLTANARNVTAAAAILLYDDVMTNIRNMLEAKNLKLSQVLHESRKRAVDTDDEEATIAIDFIEASAAAPSTLGRIDASDDLSYFRDLSRYLSDLQQIVTRLPQANGSRNSRSGSHTDWYLINEEGKISETPFDVQLQPTAVIFHRFPDIPNANEIYIGNHTAQAAEVAKEIC